MYDTRGDDTPGRFLTIADAADLLAVSAAQAYALVQSGELAAIRVGARGGWRIERFELDAYLQSKYDEAEILSRLGQAEYRDLPEITGGRTYRPAR